MQWWSVPLAIVKNKHVSTDSLRKHNMHQKQLGQENTPATVLQEIRCICYFEPMRASTVASTRYYILLKGSARFRVLIWASPSIIIVCMTLSLLRNYLFFSADQELISQSSTWVSTLRRPLRRPSPSPQQQSVSGCPCPVPLENCYY